MSSYFLGEPQLHGQCAQHKKDLFLKAVFKHVLKPSCYRKLIKYNLFNGRSISFSDNQ